MMISKGECQTEYRKIKVKIQNFPLDILKTLPFTKTTLLKNEILNIIQDQERKEFDQEKERHEIYGNIQGLRKEIKKFKESIKNSNQKELLKIQTTSENLGQKVSIFKEKQMIVFEQMQEDADILYNDLMLFQEKSSKFESVQIPIDQINEEEVEMCSDGQDSEEAYENNQLSRRLNKCKLEIEKIDKSLTQNGGQNCGWPQDDHQDFLKLKTKYNNMIQEPEFLAICIQKFPVYSDDSIQEHIQRFLKQQRWEIQKKEILELYKNLKFQFEQQELEKINKNQLQLEQQEQKLQIQKQKLQQEENQRKKQDLLKWKAERKVRSETANAPNNRESNMQNSKKNEDELEKKKQMVEVMNLLQQYKQQKQEAEMLKKQREIYMKNQKKLISQEDQKRIKQKETELLQKKLSLVHNKQDSVQQKKERQEYLMTKQNAKFLSVASKLKEQTVASKDKFRPKFDHQMDKGKYAETFGGNLNHLVRAVPVWRQNI